MSNQETITVSVPKELFFVMLDGLGKLPLERSYAAFETLRKGLADHENAKRGANDSTDTPA